MFYVFRVLGLVWIMCFVLFLCVKSERHDAFCINKMKNNEWVLKAHCKPQVLMFCFKTQLGKLLQV